MSACLWHGCGSQNLTEHGPIVDLLWKKFLKTVGKIGRPEIYRLEDPLETGQVRN